MHDRRHRPQVFAEGLEPGDEVHALDVDAPGELIQRVVLVQDVAGRFHILILQRPDGPGERLLSHLRKTHQHPRQLGKIRFQLPSGIQFLHVRSLLEAGI